MGPTLPSDLSTLGASHVHTEGEEEGEGGEEDEEDEGDLVGPSLSQMASASDYSAVDEVAERFARKSGKITQSPGTGRAGPRILDDGPAGVAAGEERVADDAAGSAHV